jgi:hypothetical protein
VKLGSFVKGLKVSEHGPLRKTHESTWQMAGRWKKMLTKIFRVTTHTTEGEMVRKRGMQGAEEKCVQKFDETK